MIKLSSSLVLSLLVTLWGCGSDQKPHVDAPTGGTDGETGGASETGGSNASGGTVANGGTVSGKGGSGTTTGGAASSKGGSTGAGGTITGGTGTGGTATGGTPPTGPVGSKACNIDAPAFCEDFETPMPGGRGGDIDEAKWAVSRFSMSSSGIFSRNPAASNVPMNAENVPTLCGKTFMGVLPPTDVQICPGITSGATSNQLNELLTDGDGFALNELRVRQPFDFTGRTGTFVFEVDAKRNKLFDGHGWWTEFWISKDPAPLPYHGAPTVGSYSSDAIGFQIAPVDQDCFEDYACNQVGRIFLAKDYDLIRDTGLPSEKIKTADGKTNRFKVLLSKDSVEVWASDYDKPETMKKIVSVNNLGLRFTVGYLHLQHSQYNADKASHATSAQTYRWDNVGFDGPVLPIPRSYDAPDKGSSGDGTWDMGYTVPTTGRTTSITLKGLDLSGASKAQLNLNVHAAVGASVRYRFNGKAWHSFTTPAALLDEGVLMRAFTLDAPLAELVAGDNTVEFDQPSQSDPIEFVGNIDITLQ